MDRVKELKAIRGKVTKYLILHNIGHLIKRKPSTRKFQNGAVGIPSDYSKPKLKINGLVLIILCNLLCHNKYGSQ